ncbi:hypothetical protein [Burkholderia pseudomallei]|uniref:hypothetical protein n=1 Tax=Burkholderia pseudomallei TaxID=28450 RepID=UPI00118633A8|nr:hypothetical protein [Burkholderia pseudomallei]
MRKELILEYAKRSDVADGPRLEIAVSRPHNSDVPENDAHDTATDGHSIAPHGHRRCADIHETRRQVSSICKTRGLSTVNLFRSVVKVEAQMLEKKISMFRIVVMALMVCVTLGNGLTMSSMTPTISAKAGKVALVIGTPGGSHCRLT